MIDISLDMRNDASGHDPDQHSATLRSYHRELWSKPLPNGVRFDLVDTTPGVYLHHRSDLGEFQLSSDLIVATFVSRAAIQGIIAQLPAQDDHDFQSIAYTIGGFTVFPGNTIDRMQTINGARGFHRSISDRFDLTLECIRRHYRGEPSPLAEPLRRYNSFFTLFKDFPGYVDFFHLQDLVTADLGQVRFLAEFQDFATPAIPKDANAYAEYRRRSIAFVTARNRRIERATR